MIQRSVGLRNVGVVKGGKREEKCGKRDLWVERVYGIKERRDRVELRRIKIGTKKVNFQKERG